MKPRVSIIAAVMNRPERITDAVANWLLVDGVDEIVVVDWNSTPPVELPAHPILQVHRVEEEPYWMLSPAYNLAADMASGDVLLKLDADYRLEPDFLKRTLMQPGQFRRGNWSIGANTNDMYLCGFLMVTAEDFRTVGGYNEAFTGYGQDDTDLYARLCALGREEVSITRLNGIHHVPHGDDLRHQNESPAGRGNAPAEFVRNSQWSRSPYGVWTRTRARKRARI